MRDRVGGCPVLKDKWFNLQGYRLQGILMLNPQGVGELLGAGV